MIKPKVLSYYTTKTQIFTTVISLVPVVFASYTNLENFLSDRAPLLSQRLITEYMRCQRKIKFLDSGYICFAPSSLGTMRVIGNNHCYGPVH